MRGFHDKKFDICRFHKWATLAFPPICQNTALQHNEYYSFTLIVGGGLTEQKSTF